MSNKGIAFAIINVSPDTPSTVTFTGIGESVVPRHDYILSPSGSPNSRSVLLNSEVLSFEGGQLSPIVPRIITDPSVPFVLPPRTIAFVAFPSAPTQC